MRSTVTRNVGVPGSLQRYKEDAIAKATKKTSRGRSQDRKRVTGGQDYEVRYEAKKTRRSKAEVNKAVKKAGNTRKKVERRRAWASSRSWQLSIAPTTPCSGVS